MSRPWNVAETGSSRHGESLTSTTSSIPTFRRRDQQPVVRPDEQAVAAADRDRAPRAADARVDDGEVDAAAA